MHIEFVEGAGEQGRKETEELLRGLCPRAVIRLSAGGITFAVPDGSAADLAPRLECGRFVKKVFIPIEEHCPLACSKRVFRLPFGAGRPFIIAGPCAVEDAESYLASALALKKAGASALRAALFKPRSSPYSFQGIGFAGAEILAEAKKQTGLPLVSEVTDARQIERMSEITDVFQIGTRNMRNYELLKAVGESEMPALLKRGLNSSFREWMLSAEYLLKYGTEILILCERGDGVPENGGKSVINFDFIRRARELTRLPVVADPSHSAPDRETAARTAREALDSGADGLLIEVCQDPDRALIDGCHTLDIDSFSRLVRP